MEPIDGIGARSLVLTVHDDNDRARRLYEALGWEQTGRVERTPGSDDLLLEYRIDL